MSAEKGPPKAIPYAVGGTDTQRDLHSLDRALTARLSYTFGIALLALGFILALVLLPGLMQARSAAAAMARRGLRAPSSVSILSTLIVPLLVCVAPAVCLLATVKPLRAGSRKAPVATLIAGLWIALGLILALVGLVVAMLSAAEFSSGDVMMALVFAILLIPATKLVYHAIRLLVAPGRGASEQAIVGVTQTLAGGLPGELDPAVGLFRLGLAHFIVGVLVCIGVGVLLSMSLIAAPVPPRPPLPPDATTPFTGELFDANGLDSKDRGLVIECIQQYQPLDQAQRDMLDSLLRESGKVLVRYASDPRSRAPLPSVAPPITTPLSKQLLAERFILDEPAMLQERQRAAGNAAALARFPLHVGRETFTWEPETISVNYPRLSNSYHEIDRLTVMDINADVCIHRGLSNEIRWGWTHQAVDRELQKISPFGSAGSLTVAQVREVSKLLLDQKLDRPRNGEHPRLHVEGVIDGGALDLRGPISRRWIDPDGSTHANSPQERARAASQVVPPRWIPISPAAPATLLLVTTVLAVTGLLMMLSSRRTPIHAAGLLSTLVFCALAATAAVIWVWFSLLNARPELRQWHWSAQFLIGAMILGIFVLVAGIVAPLSLKRKFRAAGMH